MEKMKKGWKRKLGVMLFCLVIASLALAEEQETIQLDDVVVTATRTERTLDSVPASATVITREEIENIPAQTADELLENVAGVYVRHTTGFNCAGTGNNIKMRGLGGTSEATVLVLLDGVPVHDAQNLGVEWNEFSIQDIERIEVVRGPASALYGSNAMGGVINIITRKPEKNVKTEIEGGYGSLGTYRVGVRHSGTINKFSYAIGATRLDTDGYVETPPEKVTAATSDDVASEKNNISAKLMYEIDPTASITYSGSYYHNKETGKYTYIDDFNCYTQEIYRSSLNFKKKWDTFDIQATIFGSDHTNSYDSALSPAYDSVNYIKNGDLSDFGATLQSSFRIGEYNYITIGGDFKRGIMDAEYDHQASVRTQENGGKQDVYSVFMQDEVSLLDNKLILTLGGRYDWWHSIDGYSLDTDISPEKREYDDALDSAFNPRVGALYHLSNYISLRAAVGRAFHAPDLTTLYRGETKRGSKTYYGNPDLGPEEVISYEFGIDFKIKDRLTVRSTYYHSDAEDFIYLVSTSETNVYEYRNVGEVEIDGLEVEAELKLTDDLKLFGNFTLDNSKIRKFDENPAIEGNYLTRLPKDKWSAGIVYSNPKYFTARVTGRHVGTIYDDDANTKEAGDYFTADLRLSRRITSYLDAALEVLDIFDEEYQDSTSEISPGRVIMGTIQLTF